METDDAVSPAIPRKAKNYVLKRIEELRSNNTLRNQVNKLAKERAQTLKSLRPASAPVTRPSSANCQPLQCLHHAPPKQPWQRWAEVIPRRGIETPKDFSATEHKQRAL
eukprot:PhF_6_TR41653/c0_g1_i2/m.63147